MEQTAASPVNIGDILAQKYQVTRILAVGGMGVVVVANHLQLDQPVALKFMLPEALASAEAVQRFVREARAAVRLRSEHVARVIDVGTLEDGAPYIVMEYLDGKDLSQVIEARKTMPLGTAVDWVLQASHAIAEAHSLGIIHRDLKPSNLFLTKLFDGSDLVKVLDFGISKTTGSGDLNMTKTTMVMGSPTYMSPEQMRSARHVDVRTDIWSLGVILYEMLAGRVPFDGENFSELVIKATLDPTPDLPAHLHIPREFEAALRKCLEKDPQKRYPNVADMAAAMARWAPPSSQALVDRIARMLSGESTGTSVVTPLPGAGSGPTHKVPSYAGDGPPPHVPGKPSTLSGVEAQAFPAKKGKAKLVAVLGAIALALVIGIVAATSGGDKGSGGTIEPARGGLMPRPPAEEPKKEPAKTEPAPVDPPKTEPAKTEPVAEPPKTEPAKTEPVAEPPKTEPAKTEPVKTEPAKTEPAKTEPLKTEPVKIEPVKIEPPKTEPPKAEPAKTEPPKAEPAKSDTPKPGKKASCPNPIMRNGKKVCI